jgi:hypothetical protein
MGKFKTPHPIESKVFCEAYHTLYLKECIESENPAFYISRVIAGIVGIS